MLQVAVDKTVPSGILSVDVEDYYHVEAFADRVDRDQWDSYDSRVVRNTHTVLDLFDECKVKGTFFILGWVAEHFPHLVVEIVQRGHEPACHSYWHRRIFTLSQDEFRDDTRRAKDRIEQSAGMPVLGYRAPSFSITKQSLWAFDILAELGFQYDSSVFPIQHDIYGIADAPRGAYVVQTSSGPLVEFPMTTFRWLTGRNLPVGGGGYLRIFPFWFTQFGVRKAWAENLPVMTYTHPWEFDPEQPRISGRLTSRLRHYTNLDKTAKRMQELTQLVRFSSFRDSGMMEGALAAASDSFLRTTA